MRHVIFSLAVIAILLPIRASADDAKYTVKSDKADPPKELKAGFAALLSDQTVNLLDEKGNHWATFWFRKAIPSKAAPEQVKSGLTYREIQQTTVIGAVHFAQPWTDFRKQKIPAGVYTLRLGIQPMDGDHQGTAPYGDFCLLVPAAKDEKPDPLEPKALFELSANAPGGTHPGVMLLFPNHKAEDEAKLVSKPNKIWVLNVKRAVDANGTAASLGFGLTVVGQTMQD